VTGVGNEKSQHRVRVKARCRSGHEHEICLRVHRAVHPDLRCDGDQGDGYSHGGGGGCVLPPDLDSRVEHELRERYQESRRRGWVEIAA